MFYSSQSHCKSLVLTGSYREVLDEPPEMRSCGVLCVRLYLGPKSLRLCIGSGTGRLSGCLWRLSARRPLSALTLVTFGSILSWIASVEPACRHSTVSPTPEPSTAVFQVCCRTAISQSSRPSVILSALSLSPLAPLN